MRRASAIANKHVLIRQPLAAGNQRTRGLNAVAGLVVGSAAAFVRDEAPTLVHHEQESLPDLG